MIAAESSWPRVRVQVPTFTRSVLRTRNDDLDCHYCKVRRATHVDQQRHTMANVNWSPYRSSGAVRARSNSFIDIGQEGEGVFCERCLRRSDKEVLDDYYDVRRLSLHVHDAHVGCG